MPFLIEKKEIDRITPEYYWVFDHRTPLGEDITFLPCRPEPRKGSILPGIALFMAAIIPAIRLFTEFKAANTPEGFNLNLSAGSFFFLLFLTVVFLACTYGAVLRIYRFLNHLRIKNIIKQKRWRRGVFLFPNAMVYADEENRSYQIPIQNITGFHMGSRTPKGKPENFIYATYLNAWQKEVSLELKGIEQNNELADPGIFQEWLENKEKAPSKYSPPESKIKRKNIITAAAGVVLLAIGGLGVAGSALLVPLNTVYRVIFPYKKVTAKIESIKGIFPRNPGEKIILRVHYSYQFNRKIYSGIKDLYIDSEREYTKEYDKRKPGKTVLIFMDTAFPEESLWKLEPWPVWLIFTIFFLSAFCLLLSWGFLLRFE